MNKKLDKIRSEAIETREKLSSANAEDQGDIARLDRIIRGAVIVKWMHFIAAAAFIVIAVVFTYLVYPHAKFILLMLGFAAVGYAICWTGIAIQIKLYDHAVGKVRSALKTEHDTLVES